MSDIHKKLEEYLNENEKVDDFLPDEDVQLMDRMLDFIMNLNIDFSDDQIDEVTGIIDSLADENIDDIFDDDVEEAISAKKVKIKPSDKRKRRLEYRKKRASIKLRAKKFRRTTKYKQWVRKKKVKARSGKTARGKRIRKFL